ncbi:hypothetical protein LZ495_26380 [Yinghuangia sp. KLBMP8922]|uniref:Uncharacterized protein n=1 Tax=Yinghuangia soli TaxID=2908204 RepID=A0AA41Q384_9ACTN|nr:hypothetical protein [Yinghuangia soli]MCF2530725.1 hypothetical protein [Yinghuangia soli]
METLVRTHPYELWRHTQDPALHQRWDLRFTEIRDLDTVPARGTTPKPEPTCGATPQPEPEPGPGAEPGREPDPESEPAAPAPGRRFRYATRPFPGLTIAGTGTTTGERLRPDGTATSALRFASAHPLSPIRYGRGYWRYVPTPDGIRFLTGYDYTPGFGGRRLGRTADRLFRPLMGWATAWSFDRLRLWLETGAAPSATLHRALAETAARTAAVAAVIAGTRSWALAAGTGVLALLLPPLPGTPSARRCLRRPPDRRAATPPETLARLEMP